MTEITKTKLNRSLSLRCEKNGWFVVVIFVVVDYPITAKYCSIHTKLIKIAQSHVCERNSLICMNCDENSENTKEKSLSIAIHNNKPYISWFALQNKSIG